MDSPLEVVQLLVFFSLLIFLTGLQLEGTSVVCPFLEVVMSLIPSRSLQRTFPPIVILMIGPSLGGSSNGCQTRPASGLFRLCPNINSPRALPRESPGFIEPGFLSFIAIPLTELFGSPLLKNIVGLAIGCIAAGAAGYIDGSSIKSAPAITFLWFGILLVPTIFTHLFDGVRNPSNGLESSSLQ